MKNYLSLFVFLLTMACSQSKNMEESATEEASKPKNAHHIEAVTKVFDAHGGFDNWIKMKTLRYENGGATTLVDLQNRYTLIKSEAQTVGFDGQHVWVNPPNEQAERQRMRYNLMFYFYAFPFVVGDPGVNYEELDPVVLADERYDAVKISYDAGIGDSPQDNYIILSDQQTHQMKWLMYTATFGAAEGKDDYSLIKYEGWKEQNGLLLPSSLQWYQYSDEIIGNPRGAARTFSNVLFSEDEPEMSNFIPPQGAYIIKNKTQ